MNASFKGHYQKFGSLKQYPKFGWTVFGCYFEFLHWLLGKPLQLGLVSYKESTLAYFTSYWKMDASVFFSEKMQEIDFDVYFRKFCNGLVLKKQKRN